MFARSWIRILQKCKGLRGPVSVSGYVKDPLVPNLETISIAEIPFHAKLMDQKVKESTVTVVDGYLFPGSTTELYGDPSL